jgi:signal transduction histidine kinase
MSSSSINGITEVRITDNGIGIPDEIMQKLFTLSGKINRKGTNGEASSGLGLILCKEFVERNGGSISAESKEGNGSTFSIKFGVAGDVPVRQAG